MRRYRSIPGLLALPLLLVASGAFAVGAAREAGPSDRVALEFAGVVPMEEEGASVLVLREKGAQTLLPLVVPAAVAREIEVRLRLGPAHAGRSLLDHTLEALGAKVVEVELETASETANGSTVRLAQGRRALELPARPSESLALAIRAGAPILARRRLLQDEGLAAEDLERLRRERAPQARSATRM
jgi:bifunctional DNase/RNase